MVLLAPPSPSASEEPPLFDDGTRAAGIDFMHINGMTGARFLVEIMGPGVALFDWDGDGDLDAYLVQGGPFDAGASTRRGDRLLRNDLIESGSLRMVDVTDASGLTAYGYGMGVAVGDIDGDGRPDLYLTNFGANQLWLLQASGPYVDHTETSGAGDPRWSTSAAFVDIDRDGDLDLFVGNYLDYSLAAHKPCYSAAGVEDYCSPLSYDPVPNRLLRNRGHGVFDDISAASGTAAAYGGALGVVVTDVNADGWPDLYVANDGRPNQLWINRRDGRFTDEALLSGTSVNGLGMAEASMGVDAGDFDGDGDDDLFVTHLDQETNTLYRNIGGGFFEDITFESGAGFPSRGFTGFGTAFLDVDNDGWLDLFIANGGVRIDEAQARAGDRLPLRQRNQLLRNDGGSGFEDWSDAGGPALKALEVSRGVAVGDIDNDGDTDVLIANNHGPSRLLLNRRGQQNLWLGLRLLDAQGREAVGARVGCQLQSGVWLWRSARVAASYLSSADPRVLFGLGSAGRVRRVRVQWPDGHTEEWAGDVLSAGAYHELRYGGGKFIQ